MGGAGIPGRPLDWDTEFFGYAVFALERDIDPADVPSAVQSLKRNGAELIIWQFTEGSVGHHNAAVQAGGTLVDFKCAYLLEFDSYRSRSAETTSVPLHKVCGEESRETWDALALSAGAYSRYRCDPNMRRNEHVRLYEAWLRRSLTGEIADYVWVAGDIARPAGLITLATRAPNPAIGLVAVSADSRRQGVGKRLLDKAVECSLTAGFNTLSVVTQRANEAARAMYESFGFALISEARVYHFWR